MLLCYHIKQFETAAHCFTFILAVPVCVAIRARDSALLFAFYTRGRLSFPMVLSCCLNVFVLAAYAFS